MLLLAHSNAKQQHSDHTHTLVLSSKHVHMYLERSKTLTPDRGAVALNLTPVLFNRKHLRLPGFKCLVHNYTSICIDNSTGDPSGGGLGASQFDVIRV